MTRGGGGVNVGGTGRLPAPTADTLPEWWGVLGATQLAYADRRLALSGAIAPDDWVPIPYGRGRVGGKAVTFGPVPGEEFTRAAGILVWSEGRINGITALLCNGAPLSPSSSSTSSLGFAHYLGAPGDDPQQNGSHEPVGVAATMLQIFRDAVVGGQWWRFLPATDPKIPYEWAADGEWLVLFDPRDPAQSSADPSTWTWIGAGTSDLPASRNPALIARDLHVRIGKLTDADLDDASFVAAADACQVAGFTCDIVFSKRISLGDALAVVLQTCFGAVVPSNGKTGLSLDLPRAGSPVATFSEEAGDIWDLKVEWVGRDRPTSVVVTFANVLTNYGPDATPAYPDPDNPGLRPLTVNAPAINTLEAAVVLRDYLYNSRAVTKRVTGMMSARGVLRSRGEKIELVTLRRGTFEALLEQIGPDAQGFFPTVVKPYVEGVWSTTPITQGPPFQQPPPFVNSPVVDEVAFPHITANPASCYWSPPRSMDAGHACPLYGVTPIGGGYYAHLDLGSGNAIKAGKCTAFSGRDAFGHLGPVVQGIEWSDDDATWTAVAGLVLASWTRWGLYTMGGLSVPGALGDAAEWTTPVAAHRYWRALVVAGTFLFTNNIIFWGVVAEVDPDVVSYEVRNGSSDVNFTGSPPLPLWKALPASALPTAAVPLDLRDMIVSSPIYGPNFTTVRPLIFAVRADGTKSPNGVRLVGDGAIPASAIVAAQLPSVSAPGMSLIVMDRADDVVKLSVSGSPWQPIFAPDYSQWFVTDANFTEWATDDTVVEWRIS